GGVVAVGFQAPHADAFDLGEDDVEAGGRLAGSLLGVRAADARPVFEELGDAVAAALAAAPTPEFEVLGDGLRGDVDRHAGRLGDDLELGGAAVGGPLVDGAAVLRRHAVEEFLRRGGEAEPVQLGGPGAALGGGDLLADADAAQFAEPLLEGEDGRHQAALSSLVGRARASPTTCLDSTRWN